MLVFQLGPLDARSNPDDDVLPILEGDSQGVLSMLLLCDVDLKCALLVISLSAAIIGSCERCAQSRCALLTRDCGFPLPGASSDREAIVSNDAEVLPVRGVERIDGHMMVPRASSTRGRRGMSVESV